MEQCEEVLRRQLARPAAKLPAAEELDQHFHDLRKSLMH